MASSQTLASILGRLRGEIEVVFGDTTRAVPGGYVPLYVKMMDYIVESQVLSFLLAFVVIFLVMALLFRSLSVIVVGIVPNLLPIFLTLGLMGWLSIPLDIATVTVAAIAMGISVDDSIHFIFMFRRRRQEGRSVDEAIEQTLLTSGRAIIITSLLLILGYLVFALANVKSIIFMGVLIAATMLSALLCDLLLLPALLLLFADDRKRETNISSPVGGERVTC
jgi:predicted RND superfamily exporter protein